jgi:hypothetical protein
MTQEKVQTRPRSLESALGGCNPTISIAAGTNFSENAM